MKNILANILNIFIPNNLKKHCSKSEKIYFSLIPYYNKGKNNKIVVIENGKRRNLSKFQRISHLDVKFSGNNNLVEIEFPFNVRNDVASIVINKGENNRIFIGKNFNGIFYITTYLSDNVFKCGKNTITYDIYVFLCDNVICIGDDCLISGNVIFQSDGHSVVDYETGKVLNKQKYNVKIGNHCWLGNNTSYLKGAEVADDSIVGYGSVVTKRFDKPHCVIAGNPARIVKENVSWDEVAPTEYDL